LNRRCYRAVWMTIRHKYGSGKKSKWNGLQEETKKMIWAEELAGISRAYVRPAGYYRERYHAHDGDVEWHEKHKAQRAAWGRAHPEQERAWGRAKQATYRAKVRLLMSRKKGVLQDLLSIPRFYSRRQVPA